MAVFTVHEPPRGVGDDLDHAARFAFVREGFSFLAFVAPVLWMIWHRLWWGLLAYVVVALAVNGGLVFVGASGTTAFVVNLLIGLLVGAEASALRRWTLGRRGWTTLGIVTARDLEEAERRFFDRWVEGEHGPSAVAALPLPRPMSGVRPPSGIIGLFPEPGGSR